MILTYLAEKLNRFGGRDENERREILRWILFDNHKLTSNTATYRFLRNFTDSGETDVTAFLWARSQAALSVLDSHLKSQDFIIEGHPSIADLSLCGYLFWPEEIGVSWDDYPGIAPWLERIKALDGWVHPYELMPGHPLPGTQESS